MSLKGFVVPPLQPGDRISDWKPLFKAAVTTLLAQNDGERLAIGLLPGHVNRRKAEKELVYSPISKCREGSNKWKWVEKVGALKNYFQHRAREGGGRCVKTFILVRYKHQYQNIGNNTSKFQFIWL